MFGFGAFVPLRSLLRRPEMLAMQGYFRPKGSLGAGKSRNPFDQNSGALSIQDWCHYTLLDVIEFPYLKDPENTATAYFHEYMENEKSSLIGNRFDPEILKNEVIRELYADKLIASIPTFPSKDVFETQYKGSFLNDTRQYSKLIATQLNPLLSDLLPKEFLKKAQRRKNGLVKGLFNKKITIQQASEGGNS